MTLKFLVRWLYRLQMPLLRLVKYITKVRNLYIADNRRCGSNSAGLLFVRLEDEAARWQY
jgi:hypothetical protein